MTYLITGPENADQTLLFAHGAGAGMDSPFMERFAKGLADLGVRMVRFEFPYMQKARALGKKRPPDRAPKLLAHWAQVIADHGGVGQVFIGGKSMGGRMASIMAASLEQEGTPVRGVVVTGYPFHAPAKLAAEDRRIEHFMDGYKTATLICQGARDTFGWWDEVVDYGLPDAIEFCWLDDGDHDFKPRHLSGKTMKENHETAIAAIGQWLEKQKG